MQRGAVAAVLLLVLLPGRAAAGDAGIRPAGKVADEVMIPLGPATSNSHIDENGYLRKESTQRFLRLRGATPAELKFFTDFALLTASLPQATQHSLLGSFTPDRLAGKAAVVAHKCSGVCVEHCAVEGCDPTAGGCSALICTGIVCPESPGNSCTKASSTEPVNPKPVNPRSEN